MFRSLAPRSVPGLRLGKSPHPKTCDQPGDHADSLHGDRRISDAGCGSSNQRLLLPSCMTSQEDGGRRPPFFTHESGEDVTATRACQPNLQGQQHQVQGALLAPGISVQVPRAPGEASFSAGEGSRGSSRPLVTAFSARGTGGAFRRTVSQTSRPAGGWAGPCSTGVDQRDGKSWVPEPAPPGSRGLRRCRVAVGGPGLRSPPAAGGSARSGRSESSRRRRRLPGE